MAFVVASDSGIDYLIPNDPTSERVHADSYVSIAFADEYIENHAVEAVSGWGDTTSDTAKQRLLREATTHINLRFQSLIGQKANVQVPGQPTWRQINQFPRVNLIGRDGIDYSNVIPLQVKRACVEYAIRRIQGALLPDHESTISGGGSSSSATDTDTVDVVTTGTEIKSIESSSGSKIEYAEPGTRHSVHTYEVNSLRNPTQLHEFNIYPEADYEMQPFIRIASGGRGIRVGRLER